MRVLFGLFDDTPVPPLSASELHVDLRDHQTWEERLSILSTQIRTAPSSDILDRIHRMEIPRPVLLEQVTQHACNGTPVVVLAPRKGGVTSFTRHLHAHIARIYPTWDVRPVPAVALTGESKTEYIARLGRLMGIHEPGDRLVVCVHGWSACPPSFREALGAELRALLEGGRELLRPFSLVALGGHALFLLRFTGALSCLNSAEQMDLPDFTVNEIHELMERLSPGCWSLADAGEVWRRTGGHPYLTKAMLIHWVKVRRWDAADEALDDDHTFLLYRLTEAFRDERRLRVLRSLLNRPEGVRYSVFDPEHASLQLYYDGLLRRDQRYLTFRCPAVRRLVESWPTQEQAQ